MKKTARTLLSLLLISGMVLSMTACGKKNGTQETDSNGKIVNGASKTSQTISETKSGQVIKEDDPYYNVKVSELKVHMPEGKEIQYSDISSRCVVGDRILGEVFVSYKIPDEVQKEIDRLNLNDDAQMDRYIDIYNQYQERSLQLFDMDGNAVKSIPLDPDCEFREAYDYGNGEILVVTSKFSLKECASVPQLFILSSEGEKVRDVDLQIKESLTDMRIYVLQNGGFLLASTGKFYLLDSEGKLINQETNSELNGTLLCCGGKWYALMPKYTADGEEAYLQEIDTKEGKLVGDSIKTDNKIFFVSQGENDCFMLNVNGIDKYDPITNTSTQVMSWKDTDVNSSNLSMLGGRISSEDEMVFFQMKLMDTEDRTSMDMKAGGATSWSVVKLTKADKNPHAGKTVLKLGVTGTTDPDFVEKVIAYNLDTENTARIEICDYSTETGVSMSDEDYRKVLNDSVNRLNMDMLSGNGPDILVGFSDMSQFNYDSMLLDLNPMLDADTRINRADYFDNIFRSFETDGKLYSIPLTFTVEGYAVNSKYSGAKENWTFSDFDQMASALPETVQILHSDSCDELLRAWMLSLSSHFIDNENKTVNFESEEFKALLETVKKYGKSSGLSNANMPGSMEGFALNDDILFLDDMVASCSVSLSDMQFYAMYQHNNDDKIIFSGVPSLSGTSMAASGQLSMSITTSSPNPELAWDFISDFLSEETQHIISFNTGTFPVNRNAFMKNCGLEIEINNQMIEELRKDAEASPEKVGDLSLILELSQTQADELATLISSVSSSQSYDKDVLDIVLEEAAGFFAGQRTIEDVCKNIQNRASIIVQER